jgi:hypothetical protein
MTKRYLLGVLFASSNAFAAGYIPNTSFGVGMAIDPVNPARNVLNQYYVTKETKPLGDGGSVFATGALIQSKQEMTDKLSLNAYATARYGAFKAGASYAKVSSMTFDSESVTFAVIVRTTYAPQQLNGGVSLTAAGEAALAKVADAESAERFLRRGGHELITSVTRGGFIYVVYQFRSKSSSSLSQISAALNASYAGVSAGVSAMQSALKSSSDISVDYTVLSEGVSTSELQRKLGALVRAENGDLSKVKDAVAEAITTVTPATAVVVDYAAVAVTELDQIADSTAMPLFVESFKLAERRKKQVMAAAAKLAPVKNAIATVDYLLSAPEKYRNMERDGELKQLKVKLDAQYAALNVDDLTPAQINTLESVEIPSFDPIKYVKLPLVRFEGYARSHSWGPRQNGNGDNRNQFQTLTWDVRPRISVALPSLLKEVRLTTASGSMLYQFPLNKSDEFGKSYTSEYALNYSKFLYTWGGNLITQNRNFHNDKYAETIATNASSSSKLKAEAIDVLGRSSVVDLFSPAEYGGNGMAEFNLPGYAPNPGFDCTAAGPDKTCTLK